MYYCVKYDEQDNTFNEGKEQRNILSQLVDLLDLCRLDAMEN